jgi:hypothetical protein
MKLPPESVQTVSKYLALCIMKHFVLNWEANKRVLWFISRRAKIGWNCLVISAPKFSTGFFKFSARGSQHIWRTITILVKLGCNKRHFVLNLWSSEIIVSAGLTLNKTGNVRITQYWAAFTKSLLRWKSNKCYMLVCVCMLARACVRVCGCPDAWAWACVYVHTTC